MLASNQTVLQILFDLFHAHPTLTYIAAIILLFLLQWDSLEGIPMMFIGKSLQCGPWPQGASIHFLFLNKKEGRRESREERRKVDRAEEKKQGGREELVKGCKKWELLNSFLLRHRGSKQLARILGSIVTTFTSSYCRYSVCDLLLSGKPNDL